MMSFRTVHAGTGYQYLLRSVATNDADPGKSAERPKGLSDYYQAKGTPQGRWLGSGVDGLQSATVQNHALVEESQMAALYGEGLHPDANERMQAGESLREVSLGEAFRKFTGNDDVLTEIAKEENAIRTRESRLPTEQERSDIALTIGGKHYANAKGVEGTGAEIVAWVNAKRDQQRQAVSGFDMTFSPAKSVSIAWALADEKTASQIAAVHHEAVAETMQHFEDTALYTRQGVNGVEQTKTKGAIASEFTHFDTRGGDPDLHSHVLVSNKVQGPDGKWRTVDSNALHHSAQSLSAYYDVVLQDKLNRAMGIEFVPRDVGNSVAPVWEISGVDERLIESFSSRRELARPVYDELVTEYMNRHGGKPPSKRQGYELWQQAILATRDAKKPAESLDSLRNSWRTSAENEIGADAIAPMLDRALSGAERDGGRELFDPATHSDAVARAALESVTTKRARFRESHLDTAVSTALKGYRFTSDSHRREAYLSVLADVVDKRAVSLTPAESLSVPKRLRRDTGEAIDRRANSAKFSTAGTLLAEQKVLDGTAQPVAAMAISKSVERAEKRFAKKNGYALNDGQKRLAEHLLQTGTLVASGVGPAGTGKTASMRVVADAWKAEGHAVHALSTSAAAADVLGADTGLTGRTIDSLTFTWRGRLNPETAGDLSALPVDIKAGDMLLVDEAGMATTDNLAALTEIAQESGAVLRLVGDPSQLDAVETGGLFRELARVPGTPMLTEVMRMGDDKEQAKATLDLRAGKADGLGLYEERGWLHGGGRDAMLTDAADRYLADVADGKSSLVIAGRNSDVDALNTMIRADRIDAGIVDTTTETPLARGEGAGIGDTVLARENKTFWVQEQRADGTERSVFAGRVRNGDLFTVTGIADDGSIEGKRHGSKKDDYVVLPASYVTENVHLGYASTVHRSQGATVDTCRAVIDTSMDRSALYVAASRAKESTHLHAVTEFDPDQWAEDGHMHSAGDEWPSEPREFLAYVLDHDRSQRSATETLREEAAEAYDPKRVRTLYEHGAHLAADEFTDATLPPYLDRLPKDVAQQLEVGSDQYEIVADAWKTAARRGVDPREHWLRISQRIEKSEDPAKLMSWRLRQHVPGEGPELVHVAPSVPGTDTELSAWLRTTRATLDAPAADTEAAAEAVSKRVGKLTDAELEAMGTKLTRRMAAERRQVDNAQARLSLAGEGPAVLKVREMHARGDATVAAIGRADALDKRIDQGQAAIWNIDREHRELSTERDQLGPLARGRRRDIDDRMDYLRDKRDEFSKRVGDLRIERDQMRGDVPPRAVWDRITREASEEVRAQQLVDARHDDHRAQATARRSLADATAAVNKSERNLAVVDAEKDRRAGLTPQQRDAEDKERARHAAQREKRQANTSRQRTSDTGRHQAPGVDIAPTGRDRDHGPEL